MTKIHPAIAEHVMEENARLRGLLRLATDRWESWASEIIHTTPEYESELSEIARVRAALSQKAEPTDNYTAVDMATAAAQGFRDGQAAVEQATAQGETLADRMRAAGMLTIDEMLSGASLDRFIRHAGVNDLDTYGQWLEMKCREFLSMQASRELEKREDDDLYEWVLAHAAAFQEARINFNAARPAQTEQQPVGHQFQDREGVWKQFMSERHYEDTLADGTWPIRAIYAAPIAQTAPDSDMRDNYLDLLQEVLDAKEVMRAAGIEQGSFGAMFKQLAKQTAPQPEQSGLVEAALRKAVAYLDENPFNEIASGSILHRVMGASLPAQGASK